MLNVAIPDIVRDLSTTTSSVQSAIALYSLVMAALMVGAGRLGDIIGSKKLYTIALVVFGSGTLTATFAPNVTVLIFGWSFLEGLGAAALIPISVAMISINYSGARRAAAFGIVGGFQAVAATRPDRSSVRSSLPRICRGVWRSGSKRSWSWRCCS